MIAVEGGNELRRAFRDLGGKATQKRLTLAYKEVAVIAAADARSGAAGGTPLQHKMAGAIRPKATASGAGVRLARTGAWKASGTAFWGINRRIGWFARSRYNGYEAKHQKLPVHVGNTWTAATRGEGPHRVNDALAANVTKYVDKLGDAIEAAARDVGLL